MAHVFSFSTHRTRTRLAPSTLAPRALFNSRRPARRLRRRARDDSPSSSRLFSLTSSCRPGRLSRRAPPHPWRWQPARDVWITRIGITDSEDERGGRRSGYVTGDEYRDGRDSGSCVVSEPTRGRDDTHLRDASAGRAWQGPIARRPKFLLLRRGARESSHLRASLRHEPSVRRLRARRRRRHGHAPDPAGGGDPEQTVERAETHRVSGVEWSDGTTTLALGNQDKACGSRHSSVVFRGKRLAGEIDAFRAVSTTKSSVSTARASRHS